MRAFVLALTLVATPATAADQFDLLCSGKYRERLHAKWKATETRFRIDIPGQAWCSGDCSDVRKIAAVEAGKLILSRTDRQDRVSPYSYLEIDRVAGTYQRYMNGGIGSYWDEQGKCEVLPYSGITAAKF